VSLEEALRTTYLGKLHLEPLRSAEVDRLLEQGGGCVFLWTAASDPILAVRIASARPSVGRGIIKLNGRLVALRSASNVRPGNLAAGTVMVAEGIRVSVTSANAAEDSPGISARRADLVFELAEDRRVGYRGFYRCAAEVRISEES
jgi:hypothetical protein